MRRLAVVLLLSVPALLILRAGLGLPPPRLVLEAGLPGSLRPTGRVARVDGIELVEISSGCFRMGSHFPCSPGDPAGRIAAALELPFGSAPAHDATSGECPPRWVRIPGPFWIARTEVTRAQYARFDPDHGRPHGISPEDGPETRMTHGEAEAFCAWLVTTSGLPFRLPTDEEWECACRAGSSATFGFGDDLADLARYAVSVYTGAGGERPPRPEAVAGREPNAFGLYDMHGNAWEWCAGTRPGPPSIRLAYGTIDCTTTPPFASSEDYGSVRGGDADQLDLGRECRSAGRAWLRISEKDLVEVGLRPVLTLPAGESDRIEPWLVTE